MSYSSEPEFSARQFDPDTLDGVLETELHKMIYRHLDFGPSPEDLPTVHAVMREDLLRHGLTEHDKDRVQQAFWKLAAEIQRFPTPAMVIRAMPSRQGFYESLEHRPRRDDEQAQAAFDQMRARLGMKPRTDSNQPAFELEKPTDEDPDHEQ